MKDNITKALIFESQGFIDDALMVYKNILQSDPKNKDARDAIKRLSGARQPKIGANKEMLGYFFSYEKDELDKFKRWLLEL